MIAWRRRYAREGLAGLADRPRPGRPQTVRRDRRAAILAATLTPPPPTRSWMRGSATWSARPPLFAALEIATGGVTAAVAARHRHIEFLAFLEQVAKAYPRRRLHVVLDNSATHKHHRVRAWLARHPRVRLHFSPTSASWLNLVEVFFAIIQRLALRRGDFTSVEELVAAIRFCDSWNQRCRPFRWTEDAEQLLATLNLKTHRVPRS